MDSPLASTSSRATWIKRLLWTALVLGCIIFAITMPIFGVNSLYTSPSAGVASLIFILTMLALITVEQRRKRQLDGESHEEVEMDSKKTMELGGVPMLPSAVPKPPHGAFMPCYTRIPSLLVVFLLTLLWITALVLAIYYTFWVFPDPDFGYNEYPLDPLKWRPASIIEIILVVVDIGVWVTLVELCRRERMRLIRTVDSGQR